VLVAEDEDAVRRSSKRRSGAGYTVMVARDEPRPRHRRRHAGQIDILVTDVVMRT